MGRTTGPQCKLCRREGAKLNLKGERCDTVKCSFTKRKFAPGQQSWGRRKMSKYGIQFREKQKLKRYYGVLESQFSTYFKKSLRRKVNTGEYLLQFFERRLDNVTYLLLFASSRKHARQLINHGHITVNGRKVDKASYLVKAGDIVKPINKEKVKELIKSNVDANSGQKVPQWLSFNDTDLEGHVLQVPSRDDISIQIQEQFVVEVSSK